MKLIKAIFQMNLGDRFNPDENYHVLFEMTGTGAIKRVDDGEFIRISTHTLLIEGEIIPAEQIKSKTSNH